jgi:hypothetical protein
MKGRAVMPPGRFVSDAIDTALRTAEVLGTSHPGAMLMRRADDAAAGFGRST